MAVFISYHSSKRLVVEHVAAYFSRHELTTWYAPRDVPPGSDWDEAIAHAIRNSNALVLLFCAAADTSVHVKREILLADRARIPIYWLRLEELEPEKLGYFLAPTQWIDWLDRRDSTLDSLVRDLKSPALSGRPLPIAPDHQPQANAPEPGWPAGIAVFDTDRTAAEAAAHVYFRVAQQSPDGSVVLPTGRAATLLFRGMLRIADQYAPRPFGEARILSDTETFGVHTQHYSSRTRHVVETLIEPLTARGFGPDRLQLHLLSGQISDRDPILETQRILRQWPSVVHGVSISPSGEVLGYEVGAYTDTDGITTDGCRIVELSEHGRRYIDPNQPSKSVLTIGLASAIECPALMVLAFDRSKARIIRQMMSYSDTAGVPATLLRRNERAVVVATKHVAEAAEISYTHVIDSPEEGSEWILNRFR
ncbi:TIR domain-containing protein [Nocardia sp. NPDC049707]|uniref:TIR domain-containing protein n=1 Tax=Nocardia sp. NPDC049707 TaxID=3154735 RepID=UPI00342A608D